MRQGRIPVRSDRQEKFDFQCMYTWLGYIFTANWKISFLGIRLRSFLGFPDLDLEGFFTEPDPTFPKLKNWRKKLTVLTVLL